MNKIGLNKKFRMGWNDYVRLMSLKHFPSLSCDLSHTTTMLMLIMTLMTLTFNTTKSFADDLGTTYEPAANIDDLVGIDPSDAYLSNTQTTMPTDPDKMLCFYNVGTNSFLSPGAKWGTQASLDNTAYTLWLNKPSGDSDFFNIVNNLGNSSTGTYLGFGDSQGEDALDLYMDRGAHNFVFEKAPDYKDNNKVYYVKTTKNSKAYYVQAYPGENKYCTFNEKQLTEADADYKNQEWKIITKTEYYKLVRANPANMKDVIDFSFIIKTPSFRIHDEGVLSWTANAETDKIFFGDSKQYKTYANRATDEWGDTKGGNYDHDHQRDCGKLFYSYARGAKNFQFTQDIEVHKAGWYLLRCNGFTTQVNENGKVSAHLLMAVVKDGKIDETKVYSAATLNKLKVDEATKLMQKHATGQGAGRAFFDGKYENQVQVCLDEKDLKTMDINEISEKNPVTLRIGYYVDADCDLQKGDVTCVDNFKLLYAGERRNPELILDEDQTSLLYLTNAKDSYKNSVLHLNRTLKEGQWNSLILPVDLKFGQMKRTFGDDVKVAKLTSLKDGVVTFTTVEPKQDNEVMVKAFEPYIIKPTSLTEDLGMPYTAEKFYTTEDENDNSYWLSKDCKSESNDETNRFSLTIDAGHYDITMVSLDRDKLINHLNLTEEDKTYYGKGEWQNINWDKVNWVSSTSFSTGAKEGDLTCYGTLTKTYDKNDNDKNVILDGRDNLSGDYIMRDGKIVQVPTNKVYGLKGFRCWFEVKGGSSQAKALRLEIDGISDDATSIDEINSQPSQFTSRHKGISGVFNLDGQKVREGESTQNLPKGIYIVNGRKVVVM